MKNLKIFLNIKIYTYFFLQILVLLLNQLFYFQEIVVLTHEFLRHLKVRDIFLFPYIPPIKIFRINILIATIPKNISHSSVFNSGLITRLIKFSERVANIFEFILQNQGFIRLLHQHLSQTYII
jgi:hypothetical protein